MTQEKMLKDVSLNELIARIEDAILPKVDRMIDGKIEELAGMVQRGFKAIDTRFESLEDKMDRRFDDLQGQIDNISVNYATMREHQLLSSRVKNLERRAGIRASK